MANGVLFIFALYFAILIFLTRLKSNSLQSRAFSHFRSLFPSWRFFEELVELPHIQYRAGLDSGELGEWEELIRRPVRKWSSLFLNPEGNLFLAKHDLLLQIEDDVGELDPNNTESFVDSVSYKLAKNLVQFELRELGILQEGTKVQFRLSRRLQGADTNSAEHFLTSAIYEA